MKLYSFHVWTKRIDSLSFGPNFNVRAEHMKLNTPNPVWFTSEKNRDDAHQAMQDLIKEQESMIDGEVVLEKIEKELQ